MSDLETRVANSLIKVNLKLDSFGGQTRKEGYLNSLVWDESPRDLAKAAIAEVKKSLPSVNEIGVILADCKDNNKSLGFAAQQIKQLIEERVK